MVRKSAKELLFRNEPNKGKMDTKGRSLTSDVENEVEEPNASAELSKRTKRMTIEIGPSSFASRKKKSKTKPSS